MDILKRPNIGDIVMFVGWTSPYMSYKSVVNNFDIVSVQNENKKKLIEINRNKK